MIRSASPGDGAVVTALGVSSGLFAPEHAPITDTMMEDYFDRGSHRGHVCLIDEEEGEPVAMAYYEPARATEGTWYLTMIAVRRGDQGRGRGAALLAWIEAALRASGQRVLLVETSGDAALERTRRFYVRCGYDQEARVRDYYASGDDMILFRKAL